MAIELKGLTQTFCIVQLKSRICTDQKYTHGPAQLLKLVQATMSLMAVSLLALTELTAIHFLQSLTQASLAVNVGHTITVLS